MTDKFSATDSLLGYVYQIRYALYMLLASSNDDAEISIEKLDDVAFSDEGTPLEKLQLKHTQKAEKASLSNSSPELWKTLRIWCTEFKESKLNPSETILTLVACKKAAKSSIAYKLKDHLSDSERDVAAAIKALDEVSGGTSNKKNKEAYEIYNSLEASEKQELVSSIYVLDGSPNIIDLKAEIIKLLHLTVPPKYRDDLFVRLEGWWMNLALEHLTGNKEVILKRDLYGEIFDLQGQYRDDDLPIQFLDLVAPEEEAFSIDERIFIDQLRLIEVGQKTIQKAISDYYKAFTQRSKWVADGHLVEGELSKYEKKLIDEWERLFIEFEEDFTEKSTEKDFVKSGKELYRLIQKLQIHIRPSCVEPYVMRGTYHKLSKDQDVGWHFYFKDRLQTLRDTANQGVSA